MTLGRLLLCAVLALSMEGCQSGRQALEITTPTPGGKIALLFDFDDTSHTTWIGSGYLEESMRVERSRAWDLEQKVEGALAERLRDDVNDYRVQHIAASQLALLRAQQGASHEGFMTLPRVFTTPGLFAFSKGSLDAHLRDALGPEYQTLQASGADYLLVVRQLPVVANPQSRDGADRRIMSGYGYYLKCDRAYQDCDAPRVLLRGQVELIDLRTDRYVGLHPFLMNFSLPREQNPERMVGPEAMRLIDAHLETLNQDITRFLRSTRLISERRELARSGS